METKNSNNEKTKAMPYDTVLCPVDLFRYFVRKQYSDIVITNEQIEEIRIGFAEYLNDLNLNEKQKENIIPKNTFDVIFNSDHPFRMNGFPPAYVFHFCTYIEGLQKEAKKQGITE